MAPAAAPPVPGSDMLVALQEAIPPPPQAPVLVTKVPRDASAWQVETKWDGFRALAYVHEDHVALRSRTNKSLTTKFPGVVKGLRALRLRAAVLDGEICAFDKRGLSSFALLSARATLLPPIAYVVFDLLMLEGTDLREVAIEARQDLLKKRIGRRRKGASVWASIGSLSQDLGVAVEHGRSVGFEGIVLKLRGSQYTGRKSDEWRKIKFRHEQDFAVVGYVPRKGSTVVGALLLGVATKQGFVYAGKVGIGLKAQQESNLARQLDRARSSVPTASGAPLSVQRKARWATPSLVAVVAFQERSGFDLRHSSLVGLREDVTPKQCVGKGPSDNAGRAVTLGAKRSSRPRQQQT